jgi:5-methylcytosine-specific restriction protein A
MRRALKICTHPGCPEIVKTPGESRCPLHKGEVKRKPDIYRKNSAQRGYDAKWKVRRYLFLARNPECELCGAKATVAHHVERKRDGGQDDEGNLAALCASCHSKHHALTGESFRALYKKNK